MIQKSIRKYIILSEKDINQEFRLQNVEQIRNYLLREINQNELMSKKHKRISSSAFAFLVGIREYGTFFSSYIGIPSFVIGWKICVITARIKIYKSIIEKKEEWAW